MVELAFLCLFIFLCDYGSSRNVPLLLYAHDSSWNDLPPCLRGSSKSVLLLFCARDNSKNVLPPYHRGSNSGFRGAHSVDRERLKAIM